MDEKANQGFLAVSIVAMRTLVVAVDYRYVSSVGLPASGNHHHWQRRRRRHWGRLERKARPWASIWWLCDVNDQKIDEGGLKGW